MTTDFENHCWVPSDVIEIYQQYARNVFFGPAPALLAIDLYELADQGVARRACRPRSCAGFVKSEITCWAEVVADAGGVNSHRRLRGNCERDGKS